MVNGPDEWEAKAAGGYSAEMQAELDRLATLVTETVDWSRPPDAAMRALDARNAALWNIDPPSLASVRHITLPGDPALGAAPCAAAIYTPDDPRPGLIFYIHGGGWCFLDLTTHDRLMRVLSREARMTVVAIHYRLAPEHPWPAALHDAVAAYRHVAAHRGDGWPAGPIVIAGDSAGANLALAAMLHEQRAGRPLPAGGLLFYGAFGADFETPSYRRFADGHVLTRAIMRRLWDWYVPDPRTWRDPLAVPLMAGDAQLQALPPLYLAAAEIDPLASDSYALKRRLDALGRADILHVEPGVIHGFLLMTAVLDAARRTARDAARAAIRFAANAGLSPLSG